MPHNTTVCIVGAGPGGLSTAAALIAQGVKDVVVLERGEIGQAWLDYPHETHLLSESTPERDDNMIAGVDTDEVFPHIPHPSHLAYQKYLHHVADSLGVRVHTHTVVTSVKKNPEAQPGFTISTSRGTYTAQVVVWAAGQYDCPDACVPDADAYLHYGELTEEVEATLGDKVTVIGGGNGATGTVMRLARPGRVVTLITAHAYQPPEPIDTLWKEHMELVKQMNLNGLVNIIDETRVERVQKTESGYLLTNSTGWSLTVQDKPIACLGFHPSVGPLSDMVTTKEVDGQEVLDLDEYHQSNQTKGLYLAGCVGQISPGFGLIAQFRNFGAKIASHVVATHH
jgi:putative flavoprotein involved in K+ transport